MLSLACLLVQVVLLCITLPSKNNAWFAMLGINFLPIRVRPSQVFKENTKALCLKS